MAWVPNTNTLGTIVVVVERIGWWTFITSSLNNYLNLSSTNRQQLNICPTYWQYEQVDVPTPWFAPKIGRWCGTCDLSCCNPNIASTMKCELQGPMRLKMCLSVKHTITNGGECKGWSPMILKCNLTLGVTFVWELWMFITLVGKVNKHQIGLPGYQ
jgi:hypothetical protein